MTAPIDTFRAGRFEVPVLYLDNHLIGVVKPPNMPVQADSSGDLDLLTALKGYVGERFHKPGAVYLGLVHRLDRPVGGAMVFARTSKAAARLTQGFAEHAFDKRYLAVVQGTIEDETTLTDYLVKENGTVRVCRPDEDGAKLARLTTRPLARRDGLTLVEVALHTGRPHQIRVQHAHAQLPLWGDARYGGGKPGEQIALWAYRLTLTHPTLKTPVTLASLPPRDGVWPLFETALGALEEAWQHA